MYTLPNDSNTYAIAETTTIVSNVNKGNPDNSKASDVNRYQKNGTNPTQVKNGTYKLTSARAPLAGNSSGKYGTGKQGLVVDVVQQLEVADKDFSNYGEKVPDSGYMIHITPNEYTDGCIGIPYNPNDPDSKTSAENFMNKLVDIFEKTMSEDGDKQATIQYMD